MQEELAQTPDLSMSQNADGQVNIQLINRNISIKFEAHRCISQHKDVAIHQA